jgi:DNA-binding NtrC family response regulator
MGEELTPDRKTILIVQGDPHELDSLTALLRDSNYNVLRAGNSAEAWRQSKDYKEDIHLLLSDFQMEGMSGVDLANRIKADRPRIRVLLMSGFSEGMLALGEGWRFLAKPRVHSHLHELLGELLNPESAPSVRAHISTGEKLPPASASAYRRRPPPEAGRRSRGRRESSH